MVETLPVVVCDHTGNPVAVRHTSEKGFHKSTEQGRLWVVDTATGRLLPMEGEAPLRTVVARDGFYLATLEGASALSADTSATSADTSAPGADTSATRADTSAGRGVLEQLQAAHAGSRVGDASRGEPGRGAAGAESAGTPGGRTTGATDGSRGEVLSRLQAVIAERQATMPEGSYTTHLFQKGPDKIRKKTGEEAVELLLARTNDEMISEAADLIYHLMVLLQATGLHIDAVLDRLAGRMDG